MTLINVSAFGLRQYLHTHTHNPNPNPNPNHVQSVKFQPVESTFLKGLHNDVREVKRTNKLLIPSDKTTNFYKMEPATYNDLLAKNITKSYKKASPLTTETIRQESKRITAELGIDDRVDVTANKEAFITLKDHKPNFANNPTCRLINPTKPELGKISKQILDRVNAKVISENSFSFTHVSMIIFSVFRVRAGFYMFTVVYS